jgi:hypothetical protein
MALAGMGITLRSSFSDRMALLLVFNLKISLTIVPLLSGWISKDAGQTKSGAKDFGCASAIVNQDGVIPYADCFKTSNPRVRRSSANMIRASLS